MIVTIINPIIILYHAGYCCEIGDVKFYIDTTSTEGVIYYIILSQNRSIATQLLLNYDTLINGYHVSRDYKTMLILEKPCLK